VAIVGAGDTAAEEALYLSKLTTTVHMLIRRDQMRLQGYAGKGATDPQYKNLLE